MTQQTPQSIQDFIPQSIIDEKIKPLEAEIQRLKAELEDKSLAAARWNALMGCARVRVLGSAGLKDPVDPNGKAFGNYAHIGLELWTKHSGETLPGVIELIEKFADKATAALSEPDECLEAGGEKPDRRAMQLISEIMLLGGLDNLMVLAKCAYLEGQKTRLKVNRNRDDLWYKDGLLQSEALITARYRLAGVKYDTPIFAVLYPGLPLIPTAANVVSLYAEIGDLNAELLKPVNNIVITLISQAFEDGYCCESPEIYDKELCVNDSDAIQMIDTLIGIAKKIL
jgi:hypothetical protein